MKSRDLTLFGETTLVETLALSKLIFLAINSTITNTTVIKQIERLLFNFIWGKRSHSQTYLVCTEGGGWFEYNPFSNFKSCVATQNIN